jgi:hypothetical protein
LKLGRERGQEYVDMVAAAAKEFFPDNEPAMNGNGTPAGLTAMPLGKVFPGQAASFLLWQPKAAVMLIEHPFPGT